jgi:hypothetical protein
MEVAGRGWGSSHFEGAEAREDIGRVTGSTWLDCDDCGRELPEVISILRYFFIVGESGAAKLYPNLSGVAPRNIVIRLTSQPLPEAKFCTHQIHAY